MFLEMTLHKQRRRRLTSVMLAALTAVTSVLRPETDSAVVRMSFLGSAKSEGTSTPSTMWMTPAGGQFNDRIKAKGVRSAQSYKATLVLRRRGSKPELLTLAVVCYMCNSTR